MSECLKVLHLGMPGYAEYPYPYAGYRIVSYRNRKTIGYHIGFVVSYEKVRKYVVSSTKREKKRRIPPSPKKMQARFRPPRHRETNQTPKIKSQKTIYPRCRVRSVHCELPSEFEQLPQCIRANPRGGDPFSPPPLILFPSRHDGLQRLRGLHLLPPKHAVE